MSIAKAIGRAVLQAILLLTPVQAVRSDMLPPIAIGEAAEPYASTEAERWAWARWAAGEIADFHDRCGRIDPLEPTDRRWDDPCRTISAGFLQRVLTEDLWQRHLSRQRLWLYGARIDGKLDLSDTQIGARVSFVASRFDHDLNLSRARIASWLNLDSSIFLGNLDLTSSQLDGDLYLRNGQITGWLSLVRASVKGSIELDGSFVEGLQGIIGNHAQVSGNAFLRGTSIEGPVTLRLAQISGNLELGTSDPDNDAPRCQSLFRGALEANGASVTGALILGDASFSVMPELTLMNVGLTLDISRGCFPDGLNLSGTRVAQDLRITGRGEAARAVYSPTWGQGTLLNLRNVRVGALAARQSDEPWATNLDLQGFEYQRLQGFRDAGRTEFSEPEAGDSEIEKYINWLGRDRTSSPQPYRQLASVFRAEGRDDHAESVLYAWRERELAEHWQRGEYVAATFLALLKVTIGYGIGSFMTRALWWVAGLTALGALVLWFSPPARSKGLMWRIAASLDQLLPIVEINREFAEFFNDPQRSRLTNWQFSYFCGQAAAGFLLGSFVIAALSGLIQIR